MRIVTVTLVALLGLTQAGLWFGEHGMPRVDELSALVAERQARNAEARVRNEQLRAEIRDLREGTEIIEERARRELGMVKPDEILVQYPQGSAATASP
ncbi:septum formation initiator [Sphaerotilus natans subsp. natans DSM 6575]|jgi:cell division protein FtsB|uniref:Cell division protein FtsB n=1 Tax=Sphaerotilus natans subsp. natans DSM 6575 TaxID=1286631 RepID=A0A059KGN9_9BURK|nr:cell division protein FtsB [Sphaerotilus natans]KDB50642.1 septum formation initiator [Sphaerotilus natans subsp. natans DSM 6575]SIQ06537.1 cell division protein FtsB [Sphaerotilus natans]